MSNSISSSSTASATAILDPGKVKTATTVMGVTGVSAGCGATLLVIFILSLTLIPILYGLSTDGGPLAGLASSPGQSQRSRRGRYRGLGFKNQLVVLSFVKNSISSSATFSRP
jgi:hypothetical protein